MISRTISGSLIYLFKAPRKANTPFQRIIPEEIVIENEELRDNSFHNLVCQRNSFFLEFFSVEKNLSLI
tara:strand:+ start:1124 stop:1330 length:207 start_codon:yes stop_codon:yes gene_type:complete